VSPSVIAWLSRAGRSSGDSAGTKAEVDGDGAEVDGAEVDGADVEVEGAALAAALTLVVEPQSPAAPAMPTPMSTRPTTSATIAPTLGPLPPGATG
jgi:hypothetical protein